MFVSPAPREPKKGGDQTGQGLVEFALVFPLLFILLMGLIEVALAFNAQIAVNRASQNAAHFASIMGNQKGTDCLILQQVEEDISVPNDPSNLKMVLVERAALVGNGSYEQNIYMRTTDGSLLPCELPDGTVVDVPYTYPDPDGNYPEERRCNVLQGCEDPPRSTVDNIGVRVRYRHEWVTPLNAIFDVFGGGDTGWQFTQRNIFRMEPVL